MTFLPAFTNNPPIAMKRTTLLLAVPALLATGLCPGQTPAAHADKPPLRVLAIGNSFSASLCSFLPDAAAAAGEKLEFCNLFIGGCSLKRHADNIARAGADPAFAPYAVTWFRADDPAHPAKFKANVPQMLATQKWDVVTIQQASHESWKPGSFHPWSDAVIATVRSLAPDAEIVVHETWSYNAADARIGGKFPDWPFDQAGMYARLETNYLALARENGLRVIPVGLAVQKRRAALAARGGTFDPATLSPGDPIDLKGEPVGALHWKDGKISGDTIHLNKAGEYMQAMTWLGFLFDREVRDIDFAPAAAGDAESCAALRAAAQDALDEAKARGWQDFAPKKAGPPVVQRTASSMRERPRRSVRPTSVTVFSRCTTTPGSPFSSRRSTTTFRPTTALPVPRAAGRGTTTRSRSSSTASSRDCLTAAPTTASISSTAENSRSSPMAPP